MAQNVLAGLTAKLLKEYPGLAVNLVTGIPAPDLIADGLDVVIRVGAARLQPVFPSTRRDADGCVRRQAVPRSVRRPGKPPISVAIPAGI